MNETLKTIRNRRSTRVFTQEPVIKEYLEAIIEAGIYAPSASNGQPWHLTVVQDSQLLNDLNEASKAGARNSKIEYLRKMGENPAFNIFYNAPVTVIVSGEESSLWAEVDCAAATENMLLAGESLGLGSCWIGLLAFAFRGERGDEFRKRLGLPDGYKPLFGAVFGHKRTAGGNAPARREGTVNYV